MTAAQGLHDLIGAIVCIGLAILLIIAARSEGKTDD